VPGREKQTAPYGKKDDRGERPWGPIPAPDQLDELAQHQRPYEETWPVDVRAKERNDRYLFSNSEETIPNYMARHCVKAALPAGPGTWRRGQHVLRKRLTVRLYYITHANQWRTSAYAVMTLFHVIRLTTPIGNQRKIRSKKSKKRKNHRCCGKQAFPFLTFDFTF